MRGDGRDNGRGDREEGCGLGWEFCRNISEGMEKKRGWGTEERMIRSSEEHDGLVWHCACLDYGRLITRIE